MIGSKTYYIRKLDALVSKEVRKVGKCEWCGKRGGQLQPAHIISRKNKTLRWDLANILCLCPTCHFKAHQDPLEFAEWIRFTFPKAYEYLMKAKNIVTKRSAKDLKELYEILKSKTS